VKILLLNPPPFDGVTFVRDAYCAGIAKGSYRWAPLDLVMISGTLAQSHDISVLDAGAQGISPETTLAWIKSK